MKRVLRMFSVALMGLLVAFAVVACGNNPAPATDEGSESAATSAAPTTGATSYKIGVLQLVEHDALDASNEGFVAALEAAGIDYTIDQQNAQGDQSACQTIASKLVNDGNDLILAIATPAAQAVAGATSDIPIVGTAITDFAEAGLVADNAAPGGNVTGTSDLTPVAEQIALIPQLFPEAKNVGILYCSAEANSAIQAEMAREACAANNLTAEDFTVSSSNEIQQVVESMVGKVDVIYCPTDNMIAAGMQTVAMVANENKLPTIVGETGMVNNGGLASYSIDYYELGYRAGEMAVRILQGEDPAGMAIEYLAAEECELVTNADTAAALGVDVSVLQG